MAKRQALQALSLSSSLSVIEKQTKHLSPEEVLNDGGDAASPLWISLGIAG